ncbi:hypothetical protein QQS21_000047 [Conoideocrella luteorostrata]|uniref:NACHT domain-containing protein n=1 Tax=Conoideocrella luteorostrata TaxID=1105319 RepID=A0AAJ0G497_9HYPO|nr:hypothetical protein QQS21_000047 [Conoideocrella luteorostrata]
MSNPQNYTIGCICALRTESVAVQAFLDERHSPPAEVAQHDNNSYALGRIGSHNVVIAVLPRGEYGLVNATSVAKDMLHTFPNIRIGLMVGIGGGAPSPQHDVRLGDVVVSCPGDGKTGVIQYDFNKAIQDQALLEIGTTTKPPLVVLTAIAGLETRYESDGHQLEKEITEVLQKKVRLRQKYSRPPADSDRLYKSDFTHRVQDADCINGCGDDPCTLVLRHRRDQDAGEDNLTIHYGLIASANTLMKDARVRDKLAVEKGVQCFEMEAAGLMDHFPCLVIRGICDYADSHKNKEWQGYAAMAAAAYAKDLLLQIPPNKVESERKISEVMSEMQRDLAHLQQESHKIKTNVHAMIIDSRVVSIERWLSPADPSTDANNARKSRYAGTGTWFLRSDPFTEWKHGSRRHLWLYGIPGCGKTVLTSTILDHLTQMANYVTLFFFFNFTDTRKQKLDDMLHSIAFQLYGARQESQKHLDGLFTTHDCGKRQPDTDLLSACLENMLQAVVQPSGKLVILLDALDECSQRRELLKWMEEYIPTLSDVQFLVTSRLEDGFERNLHGWVGPANCLPLSKVLVNDDIRCYVNARLDGLEFKRWATSPDVLERVREKVSEKANGMFMWAACQLDTLAECFNREELEDALESLPPDLNATYKSILENIPEKRKRKAIHLLQFLAHSERPLALEEAVDVIAVRLNEKRFEAGYFDANDRLPCPEEITGYCSSLVSLVQASEERGGLELQLAHFSVKEYLVVPNINGFPNPKITITDICLIYLGSIHADNNAEDIKDLRSRYPLAKRAAEIWMGHAKHAEQSRSTLEAVVKFLQDEPKFRVWARLYDPHRSWDENPGRPQASPLYFACLEGLENTAKRLVCDGANVNASNHYGSALEAASTRGHEAIVRLLLDHGADVNAHGNYSSALEAASARGHEAIVRLLLDHGANVNACGNYESALQLASMASHEAIVRLLLDHGADVNARDNYESALQAASENGHEAIVRLLLDHGADVNACSDYESALQLASENGHEAIMRLLLDHGANVNACGDYEPALQLASTRGHEAIVRLLLDHGADVNAHGNYSSALEAASARGHEAIVRLLLDHGADVNAHGNYSSALEAASARGHEAIVRLLLDHGADVNARDKYTSALKLASLYSHEAIVRLLLDHGADVNARDNNYSSALETTSANGHEAIVQLLLSHCADVNAGGIGSRSGLSAPSQGDRHRTSHR